MHESFPTGKNPCTSNLISVTLHCVNPPGFGTLSTKRNFNYEVKEKIFKRSFLFTYVRGGKPSSLRTFFYLFYKFINFRGLLLN